MNTDIDIELKVLIDDFDDYLTFRMTELNLDKKTCCALEVNRIKGEFKKCCIYAQKQRSMRLRRL